MFTIEKLPIDTLFWVPLMLLLLAAVLTDLLSRRIPNLLIVCGLVLGVTASLLVGGLGGLVQSLLAMLVALLVFLPLFALRAVGAGDAKLMLVVASFVSVKVVLLITLYTFVFGGFLAIVTMLSRERLGRAMGNLRLLFSSIAMRLQGAGGVIPDISATTAVRLPYGLAICAGTITWLVFYGAWS